MLVFYTIIDFPDYEMTSHSSGYQLVRSRHTGRLLKVRNGHVYVFYNGVRYRKNVDDLKIHVPRRCYLFLLYILILLMILLLCVT